RPGFAGLVLAAAVVAARHAAGQTPDEFGAQARANATRQMIVLAVQQAIGTLPPTSGQSLTYRFDEHVGEWIIDPVLGPTALRAPQVIGKSKLNLRASTSYFSASDTLGPIPYAVDWPGTVPSNYCTAFGVTASTHVGILDLAASYGITDRIE